MRAALLVVLAACAAAPPPQTPTVPAPRPAPVAPAPTVAATPADQGPPPNVRGRVTLDGAPVPYFGVVYTRDFTFPILARPFEIHSADGTFGVHIPPGTWDLIFVAPGTARSIVAGVEVGDSFDVGTIALKHGHTVAGYVLDTTGAPIPDARVELHNRWVENNATELENLVYGNLSARTDKNGRYRLTGVMRAALETGRPELLAVTADGRASLPFTAPDADANINFEVLPSATLIVFVTGGHPLGVVATSGSSRVVANEQAPGQYQFEHLPEGTYRVNAVGPAGGNMSVTVRAGAVETLTIAVTGAPPVAVEVKATTGGCHEIQIRDLHQFEIAISPCTKDVASFPKVDPGVYIACVDKQRCSPIHVQAQPAQQQLSVPGGSP